MPGARCTRSLACNKKHASVVATVAPEHPAFPHANGFNGLLRALVSAKSGRIRERAATNRPLLDLSPFRA
jgi:hypothetical protein